MTTDTMHRVPSQTSALHRHGVYLISRVSTTVTG